MSISNLFTDNPKSFQQVQAQTFDFPKLGADLDGSIESTLVVQGQYNGIILDLNNVAVTAPGAVTPEYTINFQDRFPNLDANLKFIQVQQPADGFAAEIADSIGSQLKFQLRNVGPVNTTLGTIRVNVLVF